MREKSAGGTGRENVLGKTRTIKKAKIGEEGERGDLLEDTVKPLKKTGSNESNPSDV